MAQLGDLIEELVTANRILAREGVVDSFGHISVRHPDDPRRYLLSRSLLLVTRTLPEGLQKRLVDYSVSRAVNDLHEKHGFVPYED